VPKPHGISGLIAWSKREEWRGALAALLDRHSAHACAAAGAEMEDITDVLDDYAATVLWGAAFGDLLATDLPDGRNIADDYLRRRGWKEGASTPRLHHRVAPVRGQPLRGEWARAGRIHAAARPGPRRRAGARLREARLRGAAAVGPHRHPRRPAPRPDRDQRHADAVRPRHQRGAARVAPQAPHAGSTRGGGGGARVRHRRGREGRGRHAHPRPAAGPGDLPGDQSLARCGAEGGAGARPTRVAVLNDLVERGLQPLGVPRGRRRRRAREGAAAILFEDRSIAPKTTRSHSKLPTLPPGVPAQHDRLQPARTRGGHAEAADAAASPRRSSTPTRRLDALNSPVLRDGLARRLGVHDLRL
jgi:hypothetical protein